MSFNQPFTEQLDFFRQKLNLPTQAWDDITLAAHDRAFIVAGAQSADLLADFKQALDDAMAKGTGLNQFQKDFERIVAKHGWTGWTGEGTAAGRAWRAKIIYQTNMATSYAAGRFKQLSDPELLKILPYWQYHHNDSVIHPRPLHLSWDGLTLPPDHPFWTTHYPPNGWGCQCWVSAVSQDDFMVAIANGKGPANAPEGTAGIDKGFAYAPGASLMPLDDEALKKALLDKLLALPLPIAQQLAADVVPLLLYTIDNIVQLVAAGVLAVDAAKKLARMLTGFTAADLAKIDAAGSDGAIAFASYNPDEPRDADGKWTNSNMSDWPENEAGLFKTAGLPERGKEVIQGKAKELSKLLSDAGVPHELEHSGSLAGPSSYIKIYGFPDIRISGHSKGVFNSGGVVNVASPEEFTKVLDAAKKAYPKYSAEEIAQKIAKQKAEEIATVYPIRLKNADKKLAKGKALTISEQEAVAWRDSQKK